MIEATREALAVSIFGMRLGFEAREKISLGRMDDGCPAIFLMSLSGDVARIRIGGGTEGFPFERVLEQWKEHFRAIVEGIMPEHKVQEIWNRSNFSRSSALDKLILYLHEQNLIQAKAFMLPGDREYRCAFCGINPVEGKAGKELCDECR